METSNLEHRTRTLANEYMANHPGVGRVTAKNRVRFIAAVQVAAEDLAAALRKELAPFMRNVRRLTLVPDERRDTLEPDERRAYLEPTPSEPARTPERSRPFKRA